MHTEERSEMLTMEVINMLMGLSYKIYIVYLVEMGNCSFRADSLDHVEQST